MNFIQEFVVQKINPDSIQLKALQSAEACMLRGAFKEKFVAGEILEILIEQTDVEKNQTWITGKILNSKLNLDLPDKSNLEIGPIVDGHFCFVPPKSWQAVESKFQTAYSLLEKGKWEIAEEMFYQILTEANDYIEAYNHLGLLAFRRRAWPVMLKYYKIAFQICRAKIPNDFTGELRWILPANQMFYRAVQGYALALIRSEQLENAVVLCEWLQTLDPSDYVGIGRLLVDLYLKLSQHTKLIHYFEVNGVANLDFYVLAFAFFQSREFEKSARCLLKGIRYNPHLCQLITGNSTLAEVGDVKILPQGSYTEAAVYFLENQAVWGEARALHHFLLQIIQVPSIAAHLSHVNQSAGPRIQIQDQKSTGVAPVAENLSDEKIEHLLAQPDLQHIFRSISEIDFKLT